MRPWNEINSTKTPNARNKGADKVEQFPEGRDIWIVRREKLETNGNFNIGGEFTSINFPSRGAKEVLSGTRPFIMCISGWYGFGCPWKLFFSPVLGPSATSRRVFGRNCGFTIQIWRGRLLNQESTLRAPGTR